MVRSYDLWRALWSFGAVALGLGGAACGGSKAIVDAGAPDAVAESIDLCDAFTSVGERCPRAGPARCFPMCRVGGCFCRAATGGPVWACTTDTSCLPVCGPLLDACAPSPVGPDDGGPTDRGDATVSE